MAQIPKLPQEVVENIIDCVATQSDNPNPDLWCCALTCRAFRIRSQFHIHYFVSIPSGLDESCVFERYRGSVLATYVRKLCLAGGPYDGDTFLESRWRPLLDLLPMLEILDLNNVRHRLPLSPKTFSPRYTTVNSLALWQIYVPTCHTILRLLETLPSLTSVSLMRSSWRCGGESSVVLPWLANTDTAQSWQTLSAPDGRFQHPYLTAIKTEEHCLLRTGLLKNRSVVTTDANPNYQP